MTDSEVLRYVKDELPILVPIEAEPSWGEQERRRDTWPFRFYRLMMRMQSIIIEKEHFIRKQREELIEVRKELSALKRNKG